jgi:hypothetical protein
LPGLAPTQAGKSAYKAVEIATFLSMQISSVLVTKGRQECDDLVAKLEHYFQGSVFDDQVVLSAYKHAKASIDSAFHSIEKGYGCVLVICDYHQKIGLAAKVVKRAKSFSASGMG